MYLSFNLVNDSYRGQGYISALTGTASKDVFCSSVQTA